MFPGIKLWLAQRVGNAVSQRRHIIQAWQKHRTGILSPEDQDSAQDTYEAKHTAELGLPNASNVASKQRDATSLITIDQKSESISITSDPTRLILKENCPVYGELIDCPFCRMKITVNSQLEWEYASAYISTRILGQGGLTRNFRKHVFSDTKPYVCTFENCKQAQVLFENQSSWIKHEKTHSKIWYCIFCGHHSMESEEELEKHIKETHSKRITEDQLPIITRACTKERLETSVSCPFCGDSAPFSTEKSTDLKIETLYDHMARHLQQVAFSSVTAEFEGIGIQYSTESNTSTAEKLSENAGGDTSIRSASGRNTGRTYQSRKSSFQWTCVSICDRYWAVLIMTFS